MSNFELPGRLASEKTPSQIQIAQCIGLLPNLQHLVLESCDMLDPPFMEHLPRSLKTLKIANCPDLTSDGLHSFLSKGTSCNLETLVLDHNVRLDLAFLPTLKTTCPCLKVLRMDLHYYSTHHTVVDAEAKYDDLLRDDEHPSWPSTLQELQFVHLQKWSAGGATNLFRSLLDAAESLVDLRTLVLHAHINIPWRDRVAFRDQWIERLSKVFLRRTSDPNPSLASMKTFRLSRQPLSTVHEVAPATSATRTFSHVDISPRKTSPDDDSQQTSDSDSVSKRRSKRIATKETEYSRAVSEASSMRQPTSTNNAHTSDSDEDSAAGDWRTTREKYIQGLCDTVDIRIDNQRPREEQFNESHFLDAEESGDEDWNEGGELADDAYAW